MKNSRPLPLAAAAECARLCFTAAAAPAGVRSVSRVVLNSISRACVIAGCVGPTFVHSDRRPRAWGSGGCSRCVEQHQGSGECAHWGFLSARCVEQQQLKQVVRGVFHSSPWPGHVLLITKHLGSVNSSCLLSVVGDARRDPLVNNTATSRPAILTER